MFVVEEFVEHFGRHFLVERNLLGVLGKELCKVRSRVSGGHNSVKAIENKLVHNMPKNCAIPGCTARPDKADIVLPSQQSLSVQQWLASIKYSLTVIANTRTCTQHFVGVGRPVKQQYQLFSVD